ncbi:MAG: hypothetical protein U0800_15805 [Isosphaeraceae bacterium]
MYDQILESYRRAAESAMQFQQTMMRNWTSQWPAASMMNPMGMNPGTAWLEQAQAMNRKWAETVTGMMTKHREALDAQYKAGIKAIEESFKVGEARDPEHLRRLTEDLWKHSFQALQTVTEDHIREFQAAMQKWFELVAQGTPR